LTWINLIQMGLTSALLDTMTMPVLMSH